jgi:hypothetical protein
MATLNQERERSGAIEVHGFSSEGRAVVLPRLQEVLAASGCWLTASKRGGCSAEYCVEVELAAALELYCGLVQAGVQMTELTHRTLTELCMLRAHRCALDGPPRVVSVRLLMSFVESEDNFDLPEVMAASA